MSAEPRQIASAEFWTRWEHQVVNGVFPLRRLLGCSDRAAVFLTEHKANGLANAAIKLVRTDGLGAKAQLEQWKAAAAVSHPHLVSLFDMGRWRPGRREFVFVVMEYAEQTLDQILSRRALSPDEVREMLPSTLDALAYLHTHDLVHGRLRPSNFLAVNDQLKLASDNICPAGRSVNGTLRISWYDPPELNDTGTSAAGDVWGFGMTLVQALTLGTPEWPDQRSETGLLPANLPAPFVGLARRCLSRTPANRPTVVELEAPFKSALRANSNSIATADAPTLPRPAAQKPQKKIAAPPPRSRRKRNLMLVGAAASLLIAIGWVRLSGPSPADLESTLAAAAPPVAAPIIRAPEPEPEPFDSFVPSATEPPVAAEIPPNAVVHEVKPEVPQNLSEKLRAPIDVSLRVLVDPSGEVMAALMEDPGRNKSLARLADQAAREWKFAETQQQDPRVWLLKFEFSREGVTALATEQ